jgi:hypothetical protein
MPIFPDYFFNLACSEILSVSNPPCPHYGVRTASSSTVVPFFFLSGSVDTLMIVTHMDIDNLNIQLIIPFPQFHPFVFVFFHKILKNTGTLKSCFRKVHGSFHCFS